MNLAIISTKDQILHAIDFDDIQGLRLELSKMELPIVVLPILDINEHQVREIKDLVQEHIYQGMTHFIEDLVLIVSEVPEELQD